MKGASGSLLQSAYQFCTGVREDAPSLSGAAGVEEPEPLEAPKRRTRPPADRRLATSPLGPGGEADEPNGKRRRVAGKPRTFGDEAAGSSAGFAPIELPEADAAADGLLDGALGDGAGAWHGRQLTESPGASTPGSAMREIRARPLDVDQELTRTPRGLRWVRTGYAYQPPALGTYRRRREACPQGPAYCTHRPCVPWHPRRGRAKRAPGRVRDGGGRRGGAGARGLVLLPGRAPRARALGRWTCARAGR